MVEALNQVLEKIEQYLHRAIAAQPKLDANDIDAKELCAQLAEQIRLQRYRWADSNYIPNILVIHALEDKADILDSLEIIFCSPEFARLLGEAAEGAGLELLMPIRAEVELVKRNHSALVTNSNRCSLTLSWPKSEDSLALADVVVDQEHRRIIAIHVRRSNLPVLARLTALNAEVYRNNYLLIRESTHIGRLRIVVDDATGRFVRRNDFVFAQNDDPEAICNSVSRLQARINYGADGSYYITDNGSANFTRIERVSDEPGNKTKGFIDVKPERPTRLQSGDIIHFGLAQVRFQLVEHIDPSQLAEIGSEQERVSVRSSERLPHATMKLPIHRRSE